MNKSTKGQGFFILLIICVLIGLGLTLANQNNAENYTYQDYLEYWPYMSRERWD